MFHSPFWLHLPLLCSPFLCSFLSTNLALLLLLAIPRLIATLRRAPRSFFPFARLLVARTSLNQNHVKFHNYLLKKMANA